MSLRVSFYTASFYLVLLLSFMLTGCGNGSTNNTGKLKLGITDAPVDSAESVVIHVTSATLHGQDGNTTTDLVDPTTGNVGRDIDLLLFQSGQWTGLLDEEVPAGHYSWIRLGLDLDKSYIQVNGAQHGLSCTSCDNAGYRINTSFNVEADATLTLMLDFDLRKSITNPNNANGDYILRPTVRLLASAASGMISGTVDSALIASLGTGKDCSVYVYQGFDSPLNDIYIPMNETIPATHNNPISTAKISSDGIGKYTAAFLPEGNYTIAVACDVTLDSPMTIDTLPFSEPQNVSVFAGSTTPAVFPVSVAP